VIACAFSMSFFKFFLNLYFQGNGETFEFPEMFKDIKLPYQKNEEDYYRMKDEELKIEQKNWDRLSVPPWFR
jgi:hypothetical protein